MSLFKTLMAGVDDEEDRLTPFDSTPRRSGSVFRDLMASAKPIRTVYPTIDTRGKAPIKEGDDELSFYDIPVVGNLLGNAADMATDTVGLGLQGLGAELKGLAVTPDAPAATVGRWISRGGEWLGEQAHTPEREARHTSQRWSGTSFSDILSDPGLFYEYVTDPQGLQAELGAGIGSALTFGALARLFPSTAATGLAGKALTPASRLLGSAGLTRMSQALGSNTAKDLLGSSLQFGATMGPAGALINAATIIQPLKEQGYSDKEIAKRMNSLIGEELPADIAFAALTGNVAKGTVGNALTPKNATVWQKALANASGIPLEGAGGYYSNAYQMILSDKYSDKPYGTLLDPLPNESAAGRMGVLAGVPFAIPGAYNSYQAQNARENAEQARQEHNKRFKEYSDRVGRVTVNDDGTAAYDNTPYGDIRQTVRDSAENRARQSVHGIDSFMRAISGQESSDDYDAVNYDAGEMRGKYQIDVNNWAQWAQDAGLSPDDPMTPENQELVARHKMLEYYNQFGNWRDVASMWYSGHPISDLTEEEYTRPQYAGGKKYPSIKEYVDSIMSRFQEQGGEEARGGNIFGVENYDMPTQGDNITQQVSQLKNGWSDVIPQIGGVLKEKFGLNATISSAARSADHNAAVGGAPNSYHIVRDEGGDALDIVFDRDTTQEEQDRIADYFKGTGLFSEVLYHDVGSGAHLHLGGLKTENLSRGVQFDSRTLTRPSETRRTQNNQLSQEETPKPLFDLNAEDEQTQKLLERFASERVQSLANAENPDRGTLGFFSGLFNEAGEFQNTETNRAALRERYGNEITSWANEILKQESPAQPAAPARTQSRAPRQDAPKVTNEDILTATDNFLERLRTDRTNPNTLLELQEARRAGDVAKMESILRQNNVEIAPVESTAPVAPSPQPPVQSENVVQNNQPPENILTSEQETAQETAQPQQETKPATPKTQSAQTKTELAHINRVSKATNLANKNRTALDNIVNSIQWLAAQNNIVIPAEDLTKLKKRSLKTISKWRDRLTETGALTVKPAQETTSAPPASQQEAQPPATETTATPKETPLQTALQRGREILDTQRQQEEQAQRQQEEQALRERQEAAEVEVRRKSEESYRRIVQEKAERERQEAQQREDERNADIRAKYYGNQSTAPEANEADFRIATAQISTESRAARAEQGRALLRVLYSEPFRDVQLPAGLEQSLERGDTKAIETAQGLLEQSELADRRRSDTRAGQADEQALIAQEEDIARRAAQSQRASENAQQGLMEGTAESVQNQRNPEPSEETREETQENVTRQEQPAQEDDRDVFDLLPESNELNDVESEESTEQRPTRETPQPEPQQVESTQETQSESQSETPAQIEPPKPKAKRSKKAAALHKKFKTDTHPNIGAYLDDLIETAASKEKSDERTNAQRELKTYETREAPTDEALDRVEKQLQEEKNAQQEAEREREAREKEKKERRERGRFVDDDETDTKKIKDNFRAKVGELVDISKFPEFKVWIDETLRLFDRKLLSLKSLQGRIAELRDKIEDKGLFGVAAEMLKFKAELEAVDKLGKNLYDKTDRTPSQLELIERLEKVADILSGENKVRNAEEAYRQVKEILYGKRTDNSKSNDTGATETQSEPQPQQSKPKQKRSTSKKEEIKDKLYQKFKVDTHPHIKKWIDNLFKRAASQKDTEDRRAAVEQLKNYESLYNPSSRKLNELEIKAFLANWYKDNGGDMYAPVSYIAHQWIRNSYLDREINFKEALRLLEELKRLEPELKAEFDEYAKKHGEKEAQNALWEKQMERFEKQFWSEDDTSETEQSESKSESKSKPTEAPAAEETPAPEEKTAQDSKPQETETQKEERAKERLPKSQPKPQPDTQKTTPADKGVGNWHTVAEAKDFSSLRSKIAYAFDDETIRIGAEDEVLGDKEGLLFGYIVREVDGGVQFGFYDKNNNASKREVKRICEQMDRDIRSRYGQRHSQAREKAFSKLSRARRIVSAMEAGELTPAEAYAEMEYFLKTGKLHANFTKGKADITGTPNIDTSNVVAEKDLTPAQKLLVSFGKKLGVEVVFFNNPEAKFRGVHKGGKTFLNINSNKELGGVFWHESFHWLKNNNPELYKALVKAAGITDAQRKAYLETSKRTDLQSNEAIDEEILADMMDDVAKRTGLFQSIAGKNRGLIERAIQWFKDTLNKFIDHFRNPQGKLTTAQAQALANEFGRIANQLKDPNGNQIFRYNRRTHNVELANNRERTEAELAEMTAKNARFEAKYSVDSNDNSTKSFKQRLKNLLGVEGKNIPIHKQMKLQLEDLSKMKIAADHLPEGVQVKIDKIAKVIRTGREYDWANILPEVGNAVAKQLGITQSAEMGNYIGKFILNGAPNDESAEAKEFAKAMRENPEMRNKVMAIRGTFDKWNNMSAEEQMIASTRYDKEIPPLKERAQKFWQYLRTELFDTQMPIHYHVAKFIKATGIKLADSINPEIAFRNLRGMQQRAMRMVYGNEYTLEALQKMYPNVDFSGWKPMAMILESIKAEPGSQRYKQFDQFVKACHFLDIHKHNDNVLMQQGKIRGEIRNLRAELDKADTKKKKAELERSIRKKEESFESLEQKIMDTPDAYTKDKCADLVSKYSDEFGEAQKDLVRYSRVLLDIWVDSGMMDRRRYHQLLEAYPNYVPLHREFDENPNLNTADSMKHMLGSTKDVKDAIAAIANNTFDYIQRTEKNKAKLLLANLANFDGVGGIFELVDGSSPNDGTIIHFYENGKRKALQCSDEDIVKAVNSMNQPTMNLFLKVLQVPALMLRATATGLSPGFIAGNFLRDPQDAFMVSKRYGAKSIKELPMDFITNPFITWKYITDAISMSPLYEEYAVSGAAQSDFFSFDRDYKAEAIERLTKKNYKRFASPKGVIELLGKLGEWSELTTRLRIYDKVKQSRAKEHGGINIYDDLVTAAFESRDFIDFARHGNAGRTWNTLTAFANPVLQGFDKQWRTYDFGKLKKFGGTEETQKEFYTSVARLFLGGVLPALVLSLLHKDEDWYKDDVQDWEKENYWILNESLRVSKGADLGLRFFSNLTERLISSDPVRADKVLQPLKGILPDLMPTAFLPIFECMANYDLFRRQPIVPQREVNKFKDTPELQYDSTNSKLAVLLGRVTGVSPRYIDHVIYGYTSGFGKEAMHLIDTVTPGRHTAWTRSDVPFFSRILRTPYRAPKIVSEYYEEFGRQESYAQRLAWEKKHGNPNAKPSKEYDPALHRRLKNIQRAMQNLNAAERAIMDDPKLTSEQVEDKREEIQRRRVELCRKAFQRAR